MDGDTILHVHTECGELVSRMELLLTDEDVFKPSHVKSVRACLMIFRTYLDQFDFFLSQVTATVKKRASATKGPPSVVFSNYPFYKSRDLIQAYENTLTSLKALLELLLDLQKQRALSRFFSSISLRKRFDQTTANLTENMQVLLDRQTETRQFEHRKLTILVKSIKSLR